MNEKQETVVDVHTDGEKAGINKKGTSKLGKSQILVHKQGRGAGRDHVKVKAGQN